jgi:hypothetical protein
MQRTLRNFFAPQEMLPLAMRTPGAADLKSRTASGEFDQGLQVDKAVLASTSLLGPMTFPKFMTVGAATSTNFGK